MNRSNATSPMRMNAVDFQELKTRLAPIIEQHPSSLNWLPGMWDIFFTIPDHAFRQRIVDTYSDAHIDTAFRKIMAQ